MKIRDIIELLNGAGSVTPTIRKGTGSPEGVVTAGIGSMFHRTDGVPGTTLYVKESGTGNTGWVAHGTMYGTGNLSARPAATAVPPGYVYSAQDCGFVRFFSDGANWFLAGVQPIAPLELMQDKSVDGTTFASEVSMWSPLSAPITVPSAFLTGGRVLRIQSGGGIDHRATATDTVSLRLKLDGTNPGGVVLTMDATARTSREWHLDATIEIRTGPQAGTAGDYSQMMRVTSVHNVGTTLAEARIAGSASSGLTTIAAGTGTRSIDLTAQWNVNAATDIIRCKYWSIEVVK